MEGVSLAQSVLTLTCSLTQCLKLPLVPLPTLLLEMAAAATGSSQPAPTFVLCPSHHSPGLRNGSLQHQYCESPQIGLNQVDLKKINL